MVAREMPEMKRLVIVESPAKAKTIAGYLGAGYMVDHSTVLFLLGADGGYLDHYGRALSIDEIVSRAVAKLAGAGSP